MALKTCTIRLPIGQNERVVLWRSRERDKCVTGCWGFSAPAVVPVGIQVMGQTIEQRDRHPGACEDTCLYSAKASLPADAHRVALVQRTNENKARRERQIIEWSLSRIVRGPCELSASNRCNRPSTHQLGAVRVGPEIQDVAGVTLMRCVAPQAHRSADRRRTWKQRRRSATHHSERLRGSMISSLVSKNCHVMSARSKNFGERNRRRACYPELGSHYAQVNSSRSPVNASTLLLKLAVK
jgi:hypothetical protein